MSETKSEKPKIHTIIIIRKEGTDGISLDLEAGETYLFGSNQRCQIRLKPEFVTGVADFHAKVVVDNDGKATLQNTSGQENTVKLKSGSSDVFVTQAPVVLHHKDLITICTRSFRFEEMSKREPSKDGHHGSGRSGEKSRAEEAKRHRESKEAALEKDSDAPMREWGAYNPRRAKRASMAEDDGSPAKKQKHVVRRVSEPGKLGKWADAARKVLEKEGRPLSVREIADKALEYGFVTECGKTPQNSITSTLHAEIRKPNPLFKKVSAATFSLVDGSEK